MPSHDITFCANYGRCKQRATCRRAFAQKDIERLSFAAFWKEDQECGAYWPMISHPAVDPSIRV